MKRTRDDYQPRNGDDDDDDNGGVEVRGKSTAGLDDKEKKASIVKDVVLLEKILNRNIELRSIHLNEPLKYIESEADLDVQIKKLSVVATVPQMIPELIDKHQLVALLFATIAHDNIDISVDALELLSELTDSDVFGQEKVNVDPLCFVKALIKYNGLQLLVQNMEVRLGAKLAFSSSATTANTVDTQEKRLKEMEKKQARDEATDQGIFHTLSIIENLTENMPEINEIIVKDTNILSFLLQFIVDESPSGSRAKKGGAKGESSTKKDELNPNVLYASEILCILLQNSEKNSNKFLTLKGDSSTLESMLQIISYYRKRDPQTLEEGEFINNIYDCVCNLLLTSSSIGKKQFIELEGIDLCIKVLQARNYTFPSVIRMIDYTLTNSRDLCVQFIDVGGLKSIFPLFMGKYPKFVDIGGETRSKNKQSDILEVEKHVISIVFQLFLNVPMDSVQFVHRLFPKFLEQDLEKTYKLIELHFKYIRNQDDYISFVMEQGMNSGLDKDEEDERFESYLEQLGDGLEILQQVNVILATVLLSLPEDQRKTFVEIMKNNDNETVNKIKTVLVEMASFVEVPEDSSSVSASSESEINIQEALRRKKLFLSLAEGL